MLRHLVTLLQIGAFSFFANSVNAGESSGGGMTVQLDSLKESTQLKIESLKDSSRKDLDLVLAKFDGVDKRVDAQNSKIDQGLDLLGNLLSGLGIVLTVFGVFSFLSVQSKAKKEAERVAKDWFDENSVSLKTKFDLLQERLSELELQAKESFEKHVLWVQAGASDARQQMQRQLASPLSNSVVKSDINAQSALALAEVAEVARGKSEQDYSFTDVNNLAFNYYNEGDKASAARFWEKAARHTNATDDEVAESLFNLAVTYNQLGHPKKAISIYESLIDRFSEGESQRVRAYAAKAMLNKSFIQNSLGEHDSEREGYYKFLEWESKYRQDGLNDQVSRAYNGLGFLLLCEAKESWHDQHGRDEKLNAAKDFLERALSSNGKDSFVIGNLAYCAHVMGATEEEVRSKIKVALALGGEHLFVSTLKDFLIHPIAELDESFENIFRSEWAKLKG
jgi:tetratricopeptide (TPR) repeat protein